MPTILTLRAECKGGALLPRVEASRDLNGVSPLTILIHGYNNAACDAGRSFETFLTLPGIAQGDAQASFGEVCELFWPGESRLLPALSYPFEVSVSVQAGQRLSEYLAGLARGRRTPLVVRIVCHSLGNRLALECLKHYFTQPNPPPLQVTGVLLMAAAVLVNMVEDKTALLDAAKATGQSLVLYSDHDPVLHWAFPAGQFAAGEGFGGAVGRFGEPIAGLWEGRQSMDGYVHGSYWGGDLTPAQVRRWLGLVTVRQVPTRTIPDAPLPEPNYLQTNALPTRSLGASFGTCGCGD
jgi:hypothetical protein